MLSTRTMVRPEQASKRVRREETKLKTKLPRFLEVNFETFQYWLGDPEKNVMNNRAKKMREKGTKFFNLLWLSNLWGFCFWGRTGDLASKQKRFVCPHKFVRSVLGSCGPSGIFSPAFGWRKNSINSLGFFWNFLFVCLSLYHRALAMGPGWVQSNNDVQTLAALIMAKKKCTRPEF